MTTDDGAVYLADDDYEFVGTDFEPPVDLVANAEVIRAGRTVGVAAITAFQTVIARLPKKRVVAAKTQQRVVTSTTLGYGDIEPFGILRFLTGIEALAGLVLITWSASFLFVEMQRYWPTR